MEIPTVLDQARHEATRIRLSDRLMFTGRIIVKTSHADMPLPADTHEEEIRQFQTPELRLWSYLYLVASNKFTSPDDPHKVKFGRILALHRAARNGSDLVTVYDTSADVENNQ